MPFLDLYPIMCRFPKKADQKSVHWRRYIFILKKIDFAEGFIPVADMHKIFDGFLKIFPPGGLHIKNVFCKMFLKASYW